MATLIDWFHGLFGLRSGALRVGVLNTGELVLMDAAGHAQTFSAESTDLIRDVLTDAEARLYASLPIAPAADGATTFSATSGETHVPFPDITRA